MATRGEGLRGQHGDLAPGDIVNRQGHDAFRSQAEEHVGARVERIRHVRFERDGCDRHVVVHVRGAQADGVANDVAKELLGRIVDSVEGNVGPSSTNTPKT